MSRFLHTADWQIGRQYGQFAPEDAVPLAESRLDAIERIAALATDRQVDAVLVAGDVFDAQTVAERTLRRSFNALRGFAGRWIMISGNHDAALAESVWTRARRLGLFPDNLLLLDRPGVTLLPDIGCAVLAAPLTQRHTYADLTADFGDWHTPDALLRIGMAHGSVQGVLAEGIDATNPIAADRARLSRLDYLALGDWHGMKRIDERTWYSGTPEPDRFRNNEAGQVLEVAIERPGATPVVTAHAVGRYRWNDWQEELRVASDIERLAQRLSAVQPHDVVHLALSGQCDLAGHRLIEQLLGEAAGRARSLQVERAALRLLPTDDDMAALRADGYLGEVLASLRERQADAAVVNPAVPGDEPAEAEVAREALAVLAGILSARNAAPHDKAAP
ncbi:MAG: double-strand break repair protein Mre11 [Rhizobacter sp.]|nr:double-strand break repair protein Mre11 [Rhizobacter sp.]